MVTEQKEASLAAIDALRQKLVDSKSTLPQKYRVLFSLRNLTDSESHKALMQGMGYHIV